MNKEIVIKLASTQPNVNGVYYEPESYKKAMEKFMNSKKPIVKFGYDSVDKNKKSYSPIVGFVKEIDLDNNQAIIDYRSDINFLDEGTYRMGFTLVGKRIESDKKLFQIDNIVSANIFPYQL